MSLPSFQLALYDLISNPSFCIKTKENPDLLSENYNLTLKEFNRLKNIIWQKGMATNCTLYRINRVTPIYTLMPYTCKILNDEILNILNAFWNNYAKTKLQYKDEVSLFCAFLKSKIQSGEILVPYLEEILAFESNINELRYQNTKNELNNIKVADRFILNPRIRVVTFKHDPKELIDALISSETGRLSKNIQSGSYYLLLEQNEEDIEMKQISNELGIILTNIHDYGEVPTEFIETGLILENK